jgi:hypothetical protein
MVLLNLASTREEWEAKAKAAFWLQQFSTAPEDGALLELYAMEQSRNSAPPSGPNGVGNGIGNGVGNGVVNGVGNGVGNGVSMDDGKGSVAQQLLDVLGFSEPGRAKYSFCLSALNQIPTLYKLDPRRSEFPQLAASPTYVKWVDYKRRMLGMAKDLGAVNLLTMAPQDLIWQLCVQNQCRGDKGKVRVWSDRVWLASSKWYNLVLGTLDAGNAKLGEKALQLQGEINAAGGDTRVEDNAHWVWSMLVEKYRRESRPRRAALKKQFLAVRYSGEKHPDTLFEQLEEINLQLGGMTEEAGEQLAFTEREIIDHVVEVLPQQLDTYRRMWELDEDVTLEKIKGALKSWWEGKQRDRIGVSEQGIAAVDGDGDGDGDGERKKKGGGGKKGRPAPHSINAPCNAFAQGNCKYGDKCIFQHEQPSAPAKVVLN